MSASAWGDGLATVTESGQVLDMWFPAPALGPRPADATPPPAFEALAGVDERRGTRRQPLSVRIEDLSAPPADAADAYLRLHLLSRRLVRPHGLSTAGIFGVLPNVVWTSAGPCPPEDFEETRLRLLFTGPVHGARGGQVPPDDRLRGAHRGPDRRRRPGPAGRAPGRRAPP